MKFFLKEFLAGIVLLAFGILLLPVVHVVDWSGLYLNCWLWFKSNTGLQSDSSVRMLVFVLFGVVLLVLGGAVIFTIRKISSAHAVLKIRAAQFILLLAVLFAVEIYLDWRGFAPGSLFRHFRMVERLKELPNQFTDSAGIIRYIKNSAYLPLGYVINGAGFRSRYEYDSVAVNKLKNSGKKIVMVVGDSFVAGLSAEPVTNCFADLLESDSVAVLNFGMLGTDPVQYALVCAQYVPLLKPHAVVVCIYENDLLTYERQPIPGMPVYYRTNSSPNGGMMLAQKPFEFGFAPNDNFGSAAEAYDFYIAHYTLRKSHSALVRFCSYSSILTQLYVKLAKPKTGSTDRFITGKAGEAEVQRILHGTLLKIKSRCEQEKAEVLFCGIPAAHDRPYKEPLVLRAQNDSIKIYYPGNFSEKEFNLKRGDIHFNNEGHRKYADFLKMKLGDDYLKQ